jgi:ketosteroid isomerase-like protein
MSPANPVEVVLKFEELINSRSPDAICALLTEDSAFIDSLGNRMAGMETLRKAWTGYFKMVPDYAISHTEIFANSETVAMFGSAWGTFSNSNSKDSSMKKEDSWKTPAAWRAVVRDGKIALWQVFADNEPIRAIMRRYPSGSA